jgi:hypothetical protein
MRVEILDDTYDLLYASKKIMDAEQAYGKCIYDPPTILVQQGLNPVKDAGTTIHELMHAIYNCLRGVKLPVDDVAALEECFVEMLSTGMVTVLRNNPKLLDRIYSQLRYGK